MTEYQIVWQSFGAGIGLVIASLLYSLGGRRWKLIRRIGTSLVLTLTVVVLCLIRNCFYWHFLAMFPLLWITLSIGYGSDGSIWKKVWKRFYCALAVLMAGLMMAITLDAWSLFIPHVGIGLWSIWFGVRNPVPAANEEFVICMLLNLCLVMYPFVTLG